MVEPRCESAERGTSCFPSTCGRRYRCAGLLLLLCVTQSGCTVWQLARRTVCYEPSCYDLHPEEERECAIYRGWAEEAFSCHYGAAVTDEHFYGGFLSGFVDHVFSGGDGSPPPVPPRVFWNVESRSDPNCYDVWLDGFADGARVALEGQYRDRVVLPVSPVVVHARAEKEMMRRDGGRCRGPGLRDQGRQPEDPLRLLPQDSIQMGGDSWPSERGEFTAPGPRLETLPPRAVQESLPDDSSHLEGEPNRIEFSDVLGGDDPASDGAQLDGSSMDAETRDMEDLNRESLQPLNETPDDLPELEGPQESDLDAIEFDPFGASDGAADQRGTSRLRLRPQVQRTTPRSSRDRHVVPAHHVVEPADLVPAARGDQQAANQLDSRGDGLGRFFAPGKQDKSTSNSPSGSQVPGGRQSAMLPGPTAQLERQQDEVNTRDPGSFEIDFGQTEDNQTVEFAPHSDGGSE